MDQTDRYAIELRGIDKRFGEVYANKLIDLKVRKGSIHGIVGENGAGKSTLMSIIYGFYHADKGEMLIDGILSNPMAHKMRLPQGWAWFTSTSCWSITSPYWKTSSSALRTAGTFSRAWRQPKSCWANWRGIMASTCRCTKGRRSAGWLATAGRNSQGALSRRPHPDPRRADRGTDPARGGSPVRGAEKAAGSGATIILITHKLREILAVPIRSPSCAVARWWHTSPPRIPTRSSWPN